MLTLCMAPCYPGCHYAPGPACNADPAMPSPSSADCFSPADCLWSSLPLLGKPRSFAAAVATSEPALLPRGLGAGGAVGPTSRSTTTHLFQAPWAVVRMRSAPSMLAAALALRAHAGLCSTRSMCCPAGNEVFVAGGGNGVDWYDSVLRYDRRAGPAGGWTELAPLQARRGEAGAACLHACPCGALPCAPDLRLTAACAQWLQPVAARPPDLAYCRPLPAGRARQPGGRHLWRVPVCVRRRQAQRAVQCCGMVRASGARSSRQAALRCASGTTKCGALKHRSTEHNGPHRACSTRGCWEIAFLQLPACLPMIL